MLNSKLISTQPATACSNRRARVRLVMYLITGALLALNGYMLANGIGNGFTTLPFLVFLALAILPTVALDIPALADKAWPRKLLRYRRDLGINAGLFALAHALMKSFMTLAVQPEGFWTHVIRPDVLIGAGALSIILALLVTSNNASVRALGRRWKPLHRLVWLVPGLAVIHGVFASKAFTVEGLMAPPLDPMLALLLIVPVVGLIADVVTKKFSEQSRNRYPASVHRCGFIALGLLVALALVYLFEPALAPTPLPE